MHEREINGLEVGILEYLLKSGEQRFIEIAKALFLEYGKNFGYDEGHFKVVLVRKLDALKEDGYIKKNIMSAKKVLYSVAAKKKEEIVKKVKHYRNIEEIKKLPPEEVEKLIKENKRLKRLNRIHELEQLDVLPIYPVLAKLVKEYGFKIEDFYDKRHIKDSKLIEFFNDFKEKVLNRPAREVATHTGFISTDKLINYHYSPKEKTKPEDIEIKLIPVSEAESVLNLLLKYGSDWIILTDKPIRGYHIIGAYKELLHLRMEQFEDEWLEWKEKFNLSNEDWLIVGPYICFFMVSEAGRVDLPIIIDKFLYEYVQSKKPNGVDELKKFYMRIYGENEKKALENAEKTIREFEELRKTPVEEIWRSVIDRLLKEGLDETRKQILQYLKVKYLMAKRLK